MARFGDDSAGASSFPCSSDRALLSLFTLTEAADVTEIVCIFEATTTAGCSFKGLIYADAGGTPGARIAVGAATAIPAGASTTASACVVTLAAGNYWLGLVTDSFEARMQCDASGGLSRMEAATYASPAGTWSQSGTGSARLNVYAEYTAVPSGPPQPALYYRKFPELAPEAGDAAWTDSAPASVILRNEFFGLQVPGAPTYSRSGRATARPELAASRLTTAIRAGLVRQRAEVSASRALTASRAAAAKARPEVSAVRTAVLARVARATAATRAAATAIVATVSTFSRAARAAARTAARAARAVVVSRAARAVARAEASAARTAVLARAARATIRAEVNASRAAVLSRAARATAATRAAATAVVQTLSTYSRAARAAARTAARAARIAVLARASRAPARTRAAAARAVSFLRLTRAAARTRAAAARLVALARPAAARARVQPRADRAVVMQRAARATARVRIRAAVEKIVGLPLTRPGRLFMWQPTAFAPAPTTALAPAQAVRWSDRRAVAFRPLPVEHWVPRE